LFPPILFCFPSPKRSDSLSSPDKDEIFVFSIHGISPVVFFFENLFFLHSQPKIFSPQVVFLRRLFSAPFPSGDPPRLPPFFDDFSRSDGSTLCTFCHFYPFPFFPTLINPSMISPRLPPPLLSFFFAPIVFIPFFFSPGSAGRRVFLASRLCSRPFLSRSARLLLLRSFSSVPPADARTPPPFFSVEDFGNVTEGLLPQRSGEVVFFSHSFFVYRPLFSVLREKGLFFFFFFPRHERPLPWERGNSRTPPPPFSSPLLLFLVGSAGHLRAGTFFFLNASYCTFPPFEVTWWLLSTSFLLGDCPPLRLPNSLARIVFFCRLGNLLPL